MILIIKLYVPVNQHEKEVLVFKLLLDKIKLQVHKNSFTNYTISKFELTSKGNQQFNSFIYVLWYLFFKTILLSIWCQKNLAAMQHSYIIPVNDTCISYIQFPDR